MRNLRIREAGGVAGRSAPYDDRRNCAEYRHREVKTRQRLIHLRQIQFRTSLPVGGFYWRCDMESIEQQPTELVNDASPLYLLTCDGCRKFRR